MNKRRIFTVFGAVLGCALALAACRKEEQGRITHYKPGVYLGKKDTQLDAKQMDEIRQRTADQGDSVYNLVGGGGAAKGGVNEGSLGARVQHQGGTTP